MRILIVEDDSHLAKTLEEHLRSSYVPEIASTAKKARDCIRVNSYSLIILDLGLPDGSGLEVCRTVRLEHIKTPILILTAQNGIEDKVAALDAGADDYLTKPFSREELSARIRSLLRRPAEEYISEKLTVDGLTIDTTTRAVERDGISITLRRKEFDLLSYLVKNQGRVVTRTMILENLWESDADPFSNSVDVHI